MSEHYWEDFSRAINEALRLIEQQKAYWNLDVVTMKSMDSVVAELKFLYTFAKYTLYCMNDIDASSSSSSHNTTITMKSLFIKVEAAANEFKSYLQHALIDRCTTQSQTFTTSRRRTWHPFRSKPPKLGRVFTSLNQKIAPLKLEIRAAYQGPLSTQPFQPSLPSSKIRNHSSWKSFCRSVESNLQYLYEEESSCSLGDTLRKRMKALEGSLNSLYWLLLSGDDDHRSLWKDKMMAHFGGMAVQVAHFSCWCWYNPPVEDQSPEFQAMATLLSDLHHKMDPPTPEFLDIALGFLQCHDGKVSKKSISSFLYHILDVVDEKEVLHEELVSLLTCFIKFPKMHGMAVYGILTDIKDVVIQARYLKDKSWRAHKTQMAILFAKIWSLKAHIFVISRNLITLSMDDHLEALRKGYRFLEQIFSPTDERSAEYQILSLIEGVPNKVISLYQDSRADIKVSNLLYKCLVQIKLLKAKALLLELLENYANMLLSLNHNIATLHEGLFLLLEVMINKTKEYTEDEKLILADIEVVAAGVISLCDTFPTKNLTEEAAKNMDVFLLDLLEKVQHLKAKLKGLYLQIPRLNLPKTPGLCFIEFLLRNLRDLLNRKHDLAAYAIYPIEAICSDLEFIISTCGDDFVQECKDLHTQLVDVAYQAEYMIDLMMLGNDGMRLHDLSNEIKRIKLQVIDFYGSNTHAHGVNNVPHRLMLVVSQVITATFDEVMVSLIDQKEKMIDRLTRDTLQLDIVSIVGMVGIGKTTLAKNVFYSRSVMYHFTIRAWSYVSQDYEKRDLLLALLSQIITVTDNTHAMSDADLDLLLYRHLKGKRYLIVIDDMWSTRAWDDLQLSFPDDLNGSRILLTSRFQDVVSTISDPYPLHLLSEEESWELLKTKICWDEDCPEKLLEVGQQIAKNCKGLPLTISAIAGLLNRTNQNEAFWKQIAESVSSRIVNNPETQCMEILELSYKDLPDHLKACLLYFGAFPKDKDIPARKLQWLWIAEGFVRKLESTSVEDLAEDYLMDLVSRNLVMVATRKFNGKVKACRVHDVVHDFCLLKAKDAKFLQLISANDETYSSFDGSDYDVHYEFFNPSSSITYEEYRLCFCVNREHFVASNPSGPFVRSLLYIATTDRYPKRPYDVAFICNNFKHLRVLDLESINMGLSFTNGIELLVHLRYLAICVDMKHIPPSLSKLQNLETLVVKGLKKNVVLPETIWKMKKLRHVHVSNHCIFTLPHADEDGSASQLDNLVSLSFPYFTCGKAANDMIVKFPNLRKLRCIVFGPSDEESVNVCQFLALESLCKLESLEISYFGKVLRTGDLYFPISIKKLTLSSFYLPWSHISAIGRLHNLEVLNLICRAFEGSSWEMAEGEFVNLKYLKLDTLNIVHWDASSNHLPQLQQLVVRNCKNLTGVPFDFKSISTLQKIEVHECAISVEESVRRIDEEGNEELKTVINN